jgi:hypothetical protein
MYVFIYVFPSKVKCCLCWFYVDSSVNSYVQEHDLLHLKDLDDCIWCSENVHWYLMFGGNDASCLSNVQCSVRYDLHILFDNYKTSQNKF